MTIDLRSPFRGADAVAAGLVTAKMLRGPRFRRLFTGIYVAADVEVDLRLRSRAAFLLVEGCGVLGGWSAGELLDASCGPRDAPAEVVVVPGRRRGGQPGLVAKSDGLAADETTTVHGIGVTSPLRTAFDLACRTRLLDGVIAVDALAHRYEFDPTEVLAFGRRHLGSRGSARLPEVVRRSDRLSDSPMETASGWRSRKPGWWCPCCSTRSARTRWTWPTPASRSVSSTTGESISPRSGRCATWSGRLSLLARVGTCSVSPQGRPR